MFLGHPNYVQHFPCSLIPGAKRDSRLAKGEPAGSEYDYESKIDFSVFPSLQVSTAWTCCCQAAMPGQVQEGSGAVVQPRGRAAWL